MHVLHLGVLTVVLAASIQIRLALLFEAQIPAVANGTANAVESVDNSRMRILLQELEKGHGGALETSGSGELEDDQPPTTTLERKKRFWSSSESDSTEEVSADNSSYAAAVDALMSFYHEVVQREGRRVIDMPDMRKESSDRLLFFTVTTVLSVSGVRLWLPGNVTRISRVTAQYGANGDVDMSFNVRLGDFETWGQYDVKVSGLGPKGDFNTTVRGRVVRTTVHFSELPAGEDSRCLPTVTELSLVDRGRSDVPAMAATWASQVEDVPTTLRIMRQLLNERLAQFSCGDSFVALVRSGDAAV